jgi:hypothetical protein
MTYIQTCDSITMLEITTMFNLNKRYTEFDQWQIAWIIITLQEINHDSNISAATIRVIPCKIRVIQSSSEPL